LDEGLLAADDAFGFRGAFVNGVATGDEELAEVLTAKADI
jgi:hypothetical protein